MEEILKDSNEIVPEKRKEKKKSGGRGWLVFKIIMFVIFLLYAISLIYPVFYGFLTSLKSQSEFMEDPNRLPQEWLFSNYIVVFNELSADGSNMFNMFFNSIWYTLGGTILGVFVSMCLRCRHVRHDDSHCRGNAFAVSHVYGFRHH